MTGAAGSTPCPPFAQSRLGEQTTKQTRQPHDACMPGGATAGDSGSNPPPYFPSILWARFRGYRLNARRRDKRSHENRGSGVSGSILRGSGVSGSILLPRRALMARLPPGHPRQSPCSTTRMRSTALVADGAATPYRPRPHANVLLTDQTTCLRMHVAEPAARSLFTLWSNRDSRACTVGPTRSRAGYPEDKHQEPYPENAGSLSASGGPQTSFCQTKPPASGCTWQSRRPEAYSRFGPTGNQRACTMGQNKSRAGYPENRQESLIPRTPTLTVLGSVDPPLRQTS